MHAALDTDELEPEEAQKIEDALSRASFFQLPENLQGRHPGADRFTYNLTVEKDDILHSVHMPESAVPESLQPLLPDLMHKYRGQNLNQERK